MSGDAVSRVKLHAGDDAGEVAWTLASHTLLLYASHMDFIRKVVENRKAMW